MSAAGWTATSRGAALRVHAALTGSGQAYDGERLVAHVEYKLKDVEEVLGPTDQGTPDARPAVMPARTVYGFLRSTDVRTLERHTGARLALRLEDGRTLDVAVVKQLDKRSVLFRALGQLR